MTRKRSLSDPNDKVLSLGSDINRTVTLVNSNEAVIVLLNELVKSNVISCTSLAFEKSLESQPLDFTPLSFSKIF
jgi:hypothetical protein